MNDRFQLTSLIAMALVCLFSAVSTAQDAPKTEQKTGDILHSIETGGRKRYFIVHVPKNYDPAKPAPVVLSLHGAAMNGTMMVGFTGLNETSEKNGFLVVYPSGTGTGSASQSHAPVPGEAAAPAS